MNPAVLKTVRPERVSGVRIPPPPPFSHQLSFSALTAARKFAIAGRKAAIARSRKYPGFSEWQKRSIIRPHFSGAIARESFSKVQEVPRVRILLRPPRSHKREFRSFFAPVDGHSGAYTKEDIRRTQSQM